MRGNYDAIYVIEWQHLHLAGGQWRFWSHRFTESAARRWIEREKLVRPQLKYRIVRYLREDPTTLIQDAADWKAVKS
jgi:hypothetical protein